MTKIARKWRPPLWLVVAFTLGVVLCLPIVGILFARLMWPVMGYYEAIIIAGIAVSVATFVMGLALWRLLLRPVQTMRDRVAALEQGDARALDPLSQYGTSDMESLGQSFLDMGRALRGREAVLRGYADHVTHELKSPLTVVRGAAELLASPDLPAAEREKLIARVEGAADRMTALLDAQRSLARAQEPAARGTCQLSDVADGVTVIQDGIVPLPKDALRLVLDHLVGNAKAHGASVIEAAMNVDVLTVQDDGPGVSTGNQARIFEPFFTTRRETGGTGMGLAIVQRILEAHGGQIDLAPSDAGARFKISF